MKITLSIFVAAILFACPLYAQEVNVTATVSGTTIGTEEGVSYKIEIQGGTNNDVERPKAPSATGLTLAQPCSEHATKHVHCEWTHVAEHFF